MSRERRKSSSSARTKKFAKMAKRDGIDPLEVLLNNMRFHHSQAQKALQRVMHAAEEGDPKTAREIFDEIGQLRALAQAVAKVAAPYCHSRLTAVAPLVPNESDDVDPKPRDLSKDHLADLGERYGNALKKWRQC